MQETSLSSPLEMNQTSGTLLLQQEGLRWGLVQLWFDGMPPVRKSKQFQYVC